MITGTVPVKVPEKLSELELDAGGKRIDNLGLGDTPDDVMRRSEKTGSYEAYGLLAVGLAANRPAPGIVDRIYFSTDTLVLERDTGAAWVEVVRGEAAIRLAQLAERAHTSLTGIGVADHHARYTDVEAQAQAAALIVIHAAIAAAHHTKTTDAAEIVSGTFPVARGGTGLNTIALGGILYASALDVLSRLAPTAANQVLRSTAANALQFAVLLAADIPNLDASKITSGVFVLARIPNMDWAHIFGLFPRTIADLLSDHNLANHPLAIIPIMDDGHIPDLETLSYGGPFAVAQIPALPASKITSEQFPLARMPRAASGLFLEGNGAADPIYNALVAANIPNLDTSKITTGRFPMTRMPDMGLNKIMVGRGAGNSPVEEDKPIAGVPSGLIAMWHGTIATIPAGWLICDGNNSTPNLLTRFIEGVATAATDPGTTGGSTSKSHSSHYHTMPTHYHTMPTHSHDIETWYRAAGSETGTLRHIMRGYTDAEDPGDTNSKDPGNTNSRIVSSHSDIRPLFYDVAFLMKT